MRSNLKQEVEMPEKHERQCWSCNSLDMEDKGDHVRCRACGATWNYVPVLGPDPLAAHGFYLQSPDGERIGRMRSPSKSVSRAAAKARVQK